MRAVECRELLRRLLWSQGEAPDGGYRVLVDRLWPRGVSKARAELDELRKDLAPSTDLRKWFGYREGRWTGFEARSRAELGDQSAGQVTE